MSKQINVKVDGVSLNATHFAAMKKEDAVSAMEADGISKQPAWSGKAYGVCVKAVADADGVKVKPKVTKVEVEVKE